MPKKSKKELTEEERSKMLERLAEMRNTVAKNRELKKQNAIEMSVSETKPKNPTVFKEEIDIKKKPILAEETHAKLDKIALHLEELTTLKKDKIKMKREEKEKDLKEKEEKVKNVVVVEPPKENKPVNIVPPTPSAYAPPAFKLPASMGNPFFSGGRF